MIPQIRWIPDTCYCQLIVDEKFTKLIKAEKKCKEHSKILDVDLLKIVQNDNIAANMKFTKTPTRNQIAENIKFKFDKKQQTK